MLQGDDLFARYLVNYFMKRFVSYTWTLKEIYSSLIISSFFYSFDMDSYI